MCPAAEVLIIILSITLTVFLILGIVLLVYMIVLTRQIRRVTQAAEKTVDNIGSVVSGFSKIITPVYIAEMVNKAIKKIKKNKKDT